MKLTAKETEVIINKICNQIIDIQKEKRNNIPASETEEIEEDVKNSRNYQLHKEIEKLENEVNTLKEEYYTINKTGYYASKYRNLVEYTIEKYKSSKYPFPSRLDIEYDVTVAKIERSTDFIDAIINKYR